MMFKPKRVKLHQRQKKKTVAVFLKQLSGVVAKSCTPVTQSLIYFVITVNDRPLQKLSSSIRRRDDEPYFILISGFIAVIQKHIQNTWPLPRETTYLCPASGEQTAVLNSSLPFWMSSTWCLSNIHPPMLEASSSQPWSTAVLFSQCTTSRQDSYSYPTDTESNDSRCLW